MLFSSFRAIALLSIYLGLNSPMGAFSLTCDSQFKLGSNYMECNGQGCMSSGIGSQIIRQPYATGCEGHLPAKKLHCTSYENQNGQKKCDGVVCSTIHDLPACQTIKESGPPGGDDNW
ncbi:hypothetical protein CROQUDRAFT_655877 [Cronartium quercuum f. sp. fusiforme G11]|uniref:Secreted protein n=1 Tax=Cronartium quercuum f. sp. fusiforme G11 TaxID=708437 RepID=A0A9P6TEE8_9BASI|nr:hypothetical protein CROQUDRAFT_655877 [Cronartium quercuum f. sp. fusiforme G11]